jgi:hypothetical protein
MYKFNSDEFHTHLFPNTVIVIKTNGRNLRTCKPKNHIHKVSLPTVGQNLLFTASTCFGHTTTYSFTVYTRIV